MSETLSSPNFNPAALGGALKKGMQRLDQAGIDVQTMDGATRAAVILLSLGADRAAEMLKYFSPLEAQRVSSTMASVRTLDRDVIVDALAYFKQATEHQQQVPFDPENFMRSMLDRFITDEGQQGWRVDSEIAQSLPALETLSSMKPERLFRFLQAEHPQVAATLLALVPPELSASVLDLFDTDVRSELMLRVALLDRIDPNVLSELNIVLERAFSPEGMAHLSGVGGVQPVVEILNHVAVGNDKQMLDSIRQFDPKLAEQITERMFIFEDFAAIAPRSLETLLPEVPSESLAIALKGASPSLREKLFASMSQTLAGNLRVQMDGLPPLRVQDVQVQQRKIVRLARQMADQNRISLERGAAAQSKSIVL